MNAIRTVNLTKKFKETIAVKNLDINIKKGEIFALLGVNGAGKTTLIKMLTLLLKPTSGNIYILERNITEDESEIKRLIGLSPQETAVAQTLTVRENFMLLYNIFGYNKAQSKFKTEEIANKFALTSVLDRKAGKLSGGMQRRLSIALALVGNPQIIFLDEPTLGVDVIARREIWDYINDLKGDKTIILTTHYMEEAEELADRIGIMKDGKLIKIGTANEIKAYANTDKFDEAFIKIVKEG